MKANAAQGAKGLTVLRQGTDGPQAEQPESVPCGQMSQNRRREEKPSLVQIRDKRSHNPHPPSQGDPPNHMCTESLLEVKRDGHHLTGSDANHPQASSVESISRHTGENPEIFQIRIQNQAKQGGWPKETQKCPIKRDL